MPCANGGFESHASPLDLHRQDAEGWRQHSEIRFTLIDATSGVTVEPLGAVDDEQFLGQLVAAFLVEAGFGARRESPQLLRIELRNHSCHNGSFDRVILAGLNGLLTCFPSFKIT